MLCGEEHAWLQKANFFFKSHMLTTLCDLYWHLDDGITLHHVATSLMMSIAQLIKTFVV